MDSRNVDLPAAVHTAKTYYTNNRQELVPLLPQGSRRVLEIGCGEGRFRAHLPAGCEYHGVEMSESAARVAATRLDQVSVGTYEQVAGALPAKHFDLVVCNDVIEHMPDHDAFLDQIKQKMTDQGCMVGSIPNVRHYPHLMHLLLRKDWQYADEGILDRTHQRFFTEKSWRRSLQEHGYRVELLFGINAIPFSRSPLRRLVKRSLVSLLGADTQFMQFGFRARLP